MGGDRGHGESHNHNRIHKFLVVKPSVVSLHQIPKKGNFELKILDSSDRVGASESMGLTKFDFTL